MKYEPSIAFQEANKKIAKIMKEIDTEEFAIVVVMFEEFDCSQSMAIAKGVSVMGNMDSDVNDLAVVVAAEIITRGDVDVVIKNFETH